jgi:hypothetical protein
MENYATTLAAQFVLYSDKLALVARSAVIVAVRVAARQSLGGPAGTRLRRVLAAVREIIPRIPAWVRGLIEEVLGKVEQVRRARGDRSVQPADPLTLPFASRIPEIVESRERRYRKSVWSALEALTLEWEVREAAAHE